MTGATVRGRPGTGPLVCTAEVTDVDRIGTYPRLTLHAADVAARTDAGQFVEVGVGAPGALLRRPFSVHDTSGGDLRIVVDPHGPGTSWLAGLRPGHTVALTGPLGTGFRTQRDRPGVLVGGGYGTAPLLLVSRALAGGAAVHWVAGAATADRLAVPADAHADASLHLTTEDGSIGTRGLVTDVLPDVLADLDGAIVYACGPMPMLRAVADVASAAGVPCQVAVEEHMACGLGVCWTCVVPVRDDGDTAVHNRRSCIDGPVFDGAAIAWDASRWPAPAADS